MKKIFLKAIFVVRIDVFSFLGIVVWFLLVDLKKEAI